MPLKHLLELEHDGWRSLCDKSGADFYGKVMTDNALMVLAHGHALDRDAVIQSLNDAPPWHEYEISDERLIKINDDTATLVYIGRARRPDAPEFRALMSSTYTRHPDGWRLALYQQTPIPDTDGGNRGEADTE